MSTIKVDTITDGAGTGAVDFPNGVTGVTPAGSVIYYAGNTSPTGYLKANGAAISRTTYADLFSAIGTTFGAGDGSTTFLVPDLRGEFLRGWDDSRGVDSGRAFGSAQLDQMQKLTGSLTVSNANNRGGFRGSSGAFSTGSFTDRNFADGSTINASTSGTFDSADSPNARVSSTTSGETRSRNIALLACIKY